LETKASHVIVGLFTVTLFGALFGFILWLVGDDLDSSLERYDIIFDGSVTGLGTASEVRFKGVKVGEVREISLYEGDLRKVLVGVEIDDKTPVDTTTIAKIEYLGVTGVGFIQLTGGGSDIAEPLTERSVHDRLIIPSVPSDIAQLLEGAPQVMAQTVALLGEFRKIFNPESISAVSNTLKNVEEITAAWSGEADSIKDIISNGATISEDVKVMIGSLRDMSGEFEKAIANANTLVDDDLRNTITDIRTLTATYTELGERLNDTVARAQPGVEGFTQQGLSELTLLITETRDAVNVLEKTVAAFEANPARFVLSGGGGREYTPGN